MFLPSLLLLPLRRRCVVAAALQLVVWMGGVRRRSLLSYSSTFRRSLFVVWCRCSLRFVFVLWLLINAINVVVSVGAVALLDSVALQWIKCDTMWTIFAERTEVVETDLLRENSNYFFYLTAQFNSVP